MIDPGERTDAVHDTQGNEIEFTTDGNNPDPTAEVPEAPATEVEAPVEAPAAEVPADANI